MSSGVIELFQSNCNADPNKSEAVVAVEVLASLLRRSDVNTVQGIHDLMSEAVAAMCSTTSSNPSVKSACELFQRFITLTSLDNPGDFEMCKQLLIRRADMFIGKVASCRNQIAKNFLSVAPDVLTVLLHSFSRVVLDAMTAVSTSTSGGRLLHCYVTSCMPAGLGARMTKALAKRNISCTLLPDMAVGYIMPQVDAVVLGADAVVESGGILSTLGSSVVASIACEHSKPVYVLAESFKFIRCFPLDQEHIPEEFKYFPDLESSPLAQLQVARNFKDREMDDVSGETCTVWERVRQYRVPRIEIKMPLIDYTKPSYITSLITDLGVLTPSAVSDELIKLYL